MMSWNDCSHNFEIMFTLLQAILALLGSRIQVTQASSATLSPISLVSPSSTIMQHNNTASSASLYATKMVSFTTNVNTTSYVSLTPSTSSRRESSLFSRYTKTVTLSKTVVLPTTTTSVTQSNFTSTPAIPTATPATVIGLPDGKVIAAIAGILGAILLILFGIIVWSLCIVQTLERRPSSRVQPSKMSGSVSELVWACVGVLSCWPAAVLLYWDAKYLSLS